MLLVKLILASLLESVHFLQQHGTFVILICNRAGLPNPQLFRDVDKANQCDA